MAAINNMNELYLHLLIQIFIEENKIFKAIKFNQRKKLKDCPNQITKLSTIKLN